MVQSSSVLREPSMDEILTSIREIIEENAAQSDQLLGGEVSVDVSEDHCSEASSDGTYDAALSVDDAMKALASRIGLSSEDKDFSFMQKKERMETENSAVSVDMLKEGSVSEEKYSTQKAKECNDDEFVSRSRDATDSRVELSAYCLSSVEKIAKDVLRPAIAEWLQSKLPFLLEDILREEIVKVIKKFP
ncbi:DUF2497 domain-containing protein [Bartonella sp. B41]